MCVRAIPDKPENPETSKTKLIKKRYSADINDKIESF